MNFTHLLAKTRNKAKDVLLLLLLIVIVVLTKWPLLGTIIWHEYHAVMYGSPDTFSEMLKSLFTYYPPGRPLGFYRPISMYVIPYLNFTLFQGDYTMWLVQGMAFASILITLCYMLVKIITRNRIVAFFSSLIYLTQYSSIHNFMIIDNFEYAYLIFYALSAIFFIQFTKRKNNSCYLLSIAFFILSLMSKEASITLPLLLILYLLIYGYVIRTHLNNRNYLLVFPYIIIDFVYILWRFIYPLISSKQSYGLMYVLKNTGFIAENISNIIVWAFLGKNISPISFTYSTNSPFIVIPIFTVAVFLFFLLSAIIATRNKTLIFGISFFLINSLIFVFFGKNLLSPFHVALPLMGTSIMFAECIRAFYEYLKSKYNRLYPLFFLFLLLFCSLYSFADTLQYADNADAKEMSKISAAVYNALPAPKNIKPDTLVYVIPFPGMLNDSLLNLRDFDAIRSRYKGLYNTQNIVRMYSTQDDALINYKDWDIVIIKILSPSIAINITNENTIKEIKNKMGK